jgi:hypothetical protein
MDGWERMQVYSYSLRYNRYNSGWCKAVYKDDMKKLIMHLCRLAHMCYCYLTYTFGSLVIKANLAL